MSSESLLARARAIDPDRAKSRERELGTARALAVLLSTAFPPLRPGDVRHLKPMVLRDIAERIKMDVSTISRTTSGKYAQTPFGIIHLKDLFTEGVKTDNGEEVSNRQIQSALVALVGQEDKSQPLNDTQLTELLAQQGYSLARRTIAKYRDLLDIPSATMRRIL